MRRLIVATIVLSAGCAQQTQGGVNLMPGFDPGPPPQNGLQVVLPVVKNIKAGESYEYCTWTDKILTEAIDVKAMVGTQSTSGHHVVIFYTEKHQPPNTTRVCTDDDMVTLRFTGGAGGEGVNAENRLPGDLVFRIPAGAQLVVNHHYLNASTRDIEAQSAITLKYADPGTKVIPSGSLAFVNTNLDVPVGESHVQFTCKMNRTYKLWNFLPHMHKWGLDIQVDHVKNGASTRLFDVPWSEHFTFEPPMITRDPSDPFILEKDDLIKVGCHWMNDTGKNLSFGLEMCVAFGTTINEELLENMACDDGQWTTF